VRSRPRTPVARIGCRFIARNRDPSPEHGCAMVAPYTEAVDSRPSPPPVPFRFQPLRTLRFALIITVGFTLLNFSMTANHPSWRGAEGWGRAIGTSLVFALCIGFTIDGLFALIKRALGRRFATLSGRQRALFHWGTPLLGVAIGLPLASVLTGAHHVAVSEPQIRTTPSGAIAFMLLVLALFYGFFAIRARQLRAERQAAEAQLRLLQGQMEPHFLFNTLANVVGLMEVDTPRAKRMLESFTDYLRASLLSLRASDHTLGAELDLISAYLQVVKVRMEDRLHYRIEVPDALRARSVPTLSLQPLVENAVQHGLEPTIAGGTIVIDAQVVAGALVLRVTDDGAGLLPTTTPTRRGNGTALANIRDRIQRSFGAQGALLVEPMTPSGVRATLRLPLR
jgi:signal transduction histidine kinase